MAISELLQKELETLPPPLQGEVLDFVRLLKQRLVQPSGSTQTWLDRAWGCSPEFPDRLPQPPLDDVQRW